MPAASPSQFSGWLATFRGARSTPRFAEAAKHGAKHPAIFHNLACAWLRLGDRDRAIAAIEQALRYGYEHAKLRGDDELAPLRADARFEAAFTKKQSFDLAELEETLSIYRTKRLVMRPVFAMFFYFTTPIHELGPLVADAIEKYIALITPAKLGFYKHGRWKQLKRGLLSRNLTRLRKIPAAHIAARCAMRDGDGDATDWSFSAELRNESDEASELKFTFPRSIDPETASERFLEFARGLPFESGSAGLTLSERDDCSVYEGVSWDGESVYARCLGFERHPMREWNRGTAGAHWLTLLNDKLVAKVGGAAALKKAIGTAKLEQLDAGVCIRASKRPPIGLAPKPTDLGALPTVALAIAKLRSKDKTQTVQAYARFDALEPGPYDNR